MSLDISKSSRYKLPIKQLEWKGDSSWITSHPGVFGWYAIDSEGRLDFYTGLGRHHELSGKGFIWVSKSIAQKHFDSLVLELLPKLIEVAAV